jgi:hypothetical protein
VVEALIPEAEIRDLIVELRSATAGVGTFKKRFDHLAELTGRLADQAIEKAKASREQRSTSRGTARLPFRGLFCLETFRALRT